MYYLQHEQECAAKCFISNKARNASLPTSYEKTYELSLLTTIHTHHHPPVNVLVTVLKTLVICTTIFSIFTQVNI